MDSDAELFDRYKRGDRQAFHRLYEKYRGPLYGYICNMTGSMEIAEDIYAEIWIALIHNAQNYHGEKFCSLLYRIAYNKSLNTIKKSQIELKAVTQLGQEAAIEDSQEALSYEEQVALMDKVVDCLNNQCRKTYELRRSGLSYEEIALQTNSPVGTVKSRMFNIIKKLRKQVQRHDLP